MRLRQRRHRGVKYWTSLVTDARRGSRVCLDTGYLTWRDRNGQHSFNGLVELEAARHVWIDAG